MKYEKVPSELNRRVKHIRSAEIEEGRRGLDSMTNVTFQLAISLLYFSNQQIPKIIFETFWRPQTSAIYMQFGEFLRISRVTPKGFLGAR